MSLAGWDPNKKITLVIDSVDVSTDLVDFPLLVNLGTSSGKTSYDASAVFTELGANSKKIAVEVGDTGVQCFCEIERWDSVAQTAQLHVKVPSIAAASGAVLNLYYDNTHIDNDGLYTSLLIHSDSTDGSTTFLDSSLSEHAITPVGNVHHEIDQAKFGNTSIYFDGSGDYLSIPDSDDWDFGADDFTVDFFIVRSSIGSEQVIVAQNDSTGTGATSGMLQLRFETNNTLRIRLLDGDTLPTIYTNTIFSDSLVWSHIAIVRNNNLLTVYINGVAETNTLDVTGITLNNSIYKLVFGRLGEYDSRYFNGYLDEIRISKGIARWTSNFTPPIAPYDIEYIGNTGETAAQSVWDSNFVAVYHMAQDPSGGTDCILDSTGNANHGTPAGSMTSGDLVDGPHGKAIEFDGSDDYVGCGNIGSGSGYANATIEVLFKTANNNPSTVYLLSKDGSGELTGDGSLTIEGGSYLIEWRNANALGNITGSSGVTGTWILANYTFTSGSQELFEDGVSAGTASGVTTLWDNSLPLEIGGVLTGSYLYTGQIGEVRISNIVRSNDWINLTNKSLTDTLITFSSIEPSPVSSVRQYYDLLPLIIAATTEQLYDLTEILIASILEKYGLSLTSKLLVSYSDAPISSATLRQWYADSTFATNSVKQSYEDFLKTVGNLEQIYTINSDLLRTVVSKYNISTAITPSTLLELYDILDVDKVRISVGQLYSLFTQGSILSSPVIVRINGVIVPTYSVEISFNQSEYAGSCDIVLTSAQDWSNSNQLDEVSVTIDTDTYNFIVIGKNKSENVSETSFDLQCKSRAVLLDFPYANEVSTDITPNKYSGVVNELALLQGLIVSWEIPVDETISSAELQVTGLSPLGGIRKVVNAVGGILQSHPDGTIHAIPKYEVDSDKYESVNPTYSFTAGSDFFDLSYSFNKRNGYNKYFVSDTSSTDGYTLESERITDQEYLIKAYKVPWNTGSVDLDTSELTGVSILSESHKTTVLTETVEIVNGAGKLSHNCYSLVSSSYGTRTDLGIVSFKEDGAITTASKGNSLVDVEYETKYWQWRVTNTDFEEVQLILSTLS